MGPAYFFAFALWTSLFFFFYTILDLIIHHKLKSKTKGISTLTGALFAKDAEWIIPLLLAILGTSVGLRCSSYAHVFNAPVRFMFNNPAVTKLGTMLLTLGLCEIAKYFSNSRVAVVFASAVSLFAFTVFIFRTPAEGGTGTAIVVSGACGLNAMSILANPNFPVKSPEKFITFTTFAMTALFYLAYLVINPREPMIRVERREESQRMEKV